MPQYLFAFWSIIAKLDVANVSQTLPIAKVTVLTIKHDKVLHMHILDRVHTEGVLETGNY